MLVLGVAVLGLFAYTKLEELRGRLHVPFWAELLLVITGGGLAAAGRRMFG